MKTNENINEIVKMPAKMSDKISDNDFLFIKLASGLFLENVKKGGYHFGAVINKKRGNSCRKLQPCRCT